MLLLHAHGDRNVPVSLEEAAEHLQRWQTTDTDDASTVQLDLSCRVWRRESLDVLQNFLRETVGPRLVILKIDDIIASLETEDGLRSLEFFTSVFGETAPRLTTLHLDDNALGTRGIQQLQPLLSLPTLEHVTLKNTGLSAQVAAVLADIVVQAAPPLKTLALGRNQMGAEGAEHCARLLQKLPHLADFSYDGCRPLESGTAALCRALADWTEQAEGAGVPLRKLNLCDTNIKNGEESEHPLHALCQALQRCSQLEVLNVRDAQLGPEGLEAILEAVTKAGARLRVLDVSGNELEAAGAKFLAAFLKQQRDTLEELHLESNELEHEGFLQLLPFLESNPPQLRVLDLSSNLLEADSAAALAQQKVDALQTLLLNDNELSLKHVKRIRKMYPRVETEEDDMLNADDGDDEDDDDDDDENNDYTDDKDDDDGDMVELAAQMEGTMV